MKTYIWKEYCCTYEKVPGNESPALLLVHPIGVGLSKQFWSPFTEQWVRNSETHSTIYNPDLLGCGGSDMPSQAYRPEDWAEQLAYFIEQVANEPVVLVVQGALLPVAVALMANFEDAASQVKGLVLSGPPAWRLMTTPTEPWKQSLAWRLFASPLGSAFYRYARREKFLRSFSEKQLFEHAAAVSEAWLSMLNKGSQAMASRYAVFSFLAGFWRQDYAAAIAQIQQPVLVVMGDEASTIDRKTEQRMNQMDDAQSQKRLQDYMDHFPRAQGVSIPGRNVLPYESTTEFIKAIAPFIKALR
ncbi:MAG: alpha/beta fold hydrolase [Phormidesmis sp.]